MAVASQKAGRRPWRCSPRSFIAAWPLPVGLHRHQRGSRSPGHYDIRRSRVRGSRLPALGVRRSTQGLSAFSAAEDSPEPHRLDPFTRGCNGCNLHRYACRKECCGRLATSSHSSGRGPVEARRAGDSGARDCCRERWVSVLAEGPLDDTPSTASRGGVAVEGLYEAANPPPAGPPDRAVPQVEARHSRRVTTAR